MKFAQIYNCEVASQLDKKNRIRIAIFCTITALFVAFCALFVALAIAKITSPVVGFVANGLVTVAYVWYVVLFVNVPPQYTLLLRFTKKATFGDKTRFCCQYNGEGVVVDVDGLLCKELNFEQTKLLLPDSLDNPLQIGQTYHLVSVGKMLMEYAVQGEENDN